LREALREHGIDGEDNASNVNRMILEPSGKLGVGRTLQTRPPLAVRQAEIEG